MMMIMMVIIKVMIFQVESWKNHGFIEQIDMREIMTIPTGLLMEA